MKKIAFLLIITLAGFVSKSQTLSLNCESGNRSIEQGNCWAFGSVSYSNLEFRINGFWSMRTNQLTNLSTSACWVKTPWFKPGSGNITMKTRLENASGTSRGIVFTYVPYDANAISSTKEGTGTAFYKYNFATPLDIWVKDITVPIPSAIANSNQAYKIIISFIGSGGFGRAFADDLVIPGTYWSNPSNNCLPQALIVDADNDGVQDSDDAYPNDAARAYNNVFPSSGYSTLMFEDLWPSLGDYDFNDYVVDYKINRVTNAANNVVEIKAEFVSRAAGASRPNGFAFSFDGLSGSRITSVSGNKIFTPNPHTFDANGTEAGQTDAHFVVVSNIFKVLIPQGGGSGGVNTNPTAVRVPNDTTRMTISFNTTTNTTNLSEVTLAKFNPYLIVNQTRGTEIHLADKTPSSLVNSALLGTADDNSNAGSNRFYKTKNNLPWAINVTSSIPYMKETIDFTKGYNNFIDWSVSNGTTNTDWYLNLSNFRDNNNLY
jgi:LruC domain-containing protein